MIILQILAWGFVLFSIVGVIVMSINEAKEKKEHKGDTEYWKKKYSQEHQTPDHIEIVFFVIMIVIVFYWLGGGMGRGF